MAPIQTARTDRTFRYDFALDGGAVGAVALRGDYKLPSGAIITDALLHVDTALASATGTARLDVEAAGDVQAVAAATAAPWSTTGAKRVTLTATSAPVKLTADRFPTLTIATAALTAGKFRLVLTVVEVI